jgi:hypothetical protein
LFSCSKIPITRVEGRNILEIAGKGWKSMAYEIGAVEIAGK